MTFSLSRLSDTRTVFFFLSLKSLFGLKQIFFLWTWNKKKNENKSNRSLLLLSLSSRYMKNTLRLMTDEGKSNICSTVHEGRDLWPCFLQNRVIDSKAQQNMQKTHLRRSVLKRNYWLQDKDLSRMTGNLSICWRDWGCICPSDRLPSSLPFVRTSLLTLEKLFHNFWRSSKEEWTGQQPPFPLLLTKRGRICSSCLQLFFCFESKVFWTKSSSLLPLEVMTQVANFALYFKGRI